MQDKDRNEKHKRNFDSDHVMSELKDLLQGPNDEHVGHLPESKKPNIYILGCPRSGTTFIHQFLINNFDLSYPSNFLSRFYYAPYTGAKIQYLINDLDTRGELLNNSGTLDYKSELGKTKGPLSPHEFTFYWRHFFEKDASGYITNIKEQELKGFLTGLNSIKHVFDKPFIMKGVFANNSIARFMENRSNDLVIYIKRDVAYNAQSLIESRKEFFDDTSKWYSFGIPEMNNLDQLSVEEQVVLQVMKTNELIEIELQKLNSNQVVTIDYDHLNDELPRLIEALKSRNIPQKENQSESFVPKNDIRLDHNSWNKILDSINKHSA